MRIWYQSMTELELLPAYANTISEHLAASAGNDMDVVLRGLTPGSYGGLSPMAVLQYPLGFHRALSQVLDNVEVAAAEGFDAFLMGSFVSPFLREARCAVDIPVTSMSESVLLTCHSLSRRTALICISDAQVGTATDLIETLRLTDEVFLIRAVDEAADETAVAGALSGDGEALRDSFVRVSRQAVADGADLIVPAEGILSEVVRSHGVRSVDGAPIVDCVETALSHTRMLVDLSASGAVAPGRLRTYPKLP